MTHANDGETTGGAKSAFLEDWMTRDELARLIGLTTDTLQKWQALRIGPPITKIGRRVFYQRESVRAWMMEQEQKPRSPGKR